MAKKGKRPTTQEHLEIEDIIDGIVILKNGTAAAVLQTTAINFDLLSEREQDAIIIAYAGLLNSLTYPIEIVIRTKRVNISNYLVRLDTARKETHNPSLAAQIGRYETFIRDLVSKNQVLDKRFYVVVPYFPTAAAQVKGAGGIFKKKSAVASKWLTLEKAKENLKNKIEHLVKQFGQVGIRAVPLDTAELVELYYDMYNPEVGREQKVALATREYTAPLVEPELAPIEENETATAETAQK